MASNVPLETMLAQASNKPKPRKKRRKKEKEEPAKDKAAQSLKAKQVASLTPERRSEIAREAAKARWAKKEDGGPEQPPPEKP